MSEKFTQKHFDRVVGVTSEEDTKKLHQAIGNNLNEGGVFMEGIELTKTEHDKHIIDFVLKAADEILSTYGREKILQIDYDHIHLLPEGGTKKINPSVIDGAYDIHMGSVIVDRFESDVYFALILFHELMHTKSYKALQVTTDGQLAKYRAGIRMVTRDGQTSYFGNLEEGIIDYLTEKFYQKYIPQAFFVSEDIPPYTTHRSEERSELQYVVERVSTASGSEVEKVMEMFIRAHVTGNIVEIARVIEKYIGKGKFRELGELSSDGDV